MVITESSSIVDYGLDTVMTVNGSVVTYFTRYSKKIAINVIVKVKFNCIIKKILIKNFQVSKYMSRLNFPLKFLTFEITVFEFFSYFGTH